MSPKVDVIAWLDLVCLFNGILLYSHILHIHLHACRIITTTQKRRVTQVFRKIYLSFYLKGLCVRGSWRPNRTATYWPPLLWPHQRFFPVLLGCSTGGTGAQSLWVLVFSTASYLQLIWSPTDSISCALSYIIVQHLPSCGRPKSHSFNPSTVKVIFWYSLTGCTCYLHQWISYFDSPAGS